MSYGKIIPTNKVVDEVYEKHVKHVMMCCQVSQYTC